MPRRQRLLRPDAECPFCGTRPQESIPATERLRYRQLEPDRPVRWVRCWNRRCGKVYRITARAYQEAEDEVVSPDSEAA